MIINQLNYKAPEKARVTEELVSYMDLVKFTLHVTLLMRKASVCFLFVWPQYEIRWKPMSKRPIGRCKTRWEDDVLEHKYTQLEESSTEYR